MARTEVSGATALSAIDVPPGSGARRAGPDAGRGPGTTGAADTTRWEEFGARPAGGAPPGGGPPGGIAPRELGTFARRLAGAWWGSALLLGLGAIALGVIALVWPGRTVAVLGVLFGIYLLINGIVLFVNALGPRFTGGTRWLMFLSGTASVILGLLCFRSVAQSVVLLALWISIGWLFRGGAELAAAAAGGPGAGWSAAMGVLSVLAGAVLLIFPIESVLVLAVVAGCWLIAIGLLEVVLALRLRRLSRRPA
ncbi:hypothetical protein GCM10027160_13930 [Streptomyces calidiresistens]|uniref:HdeD family acid-resistance protein n=1 Tax=Streptomyces calidiresistens TaxID=1485586 RepID=A0A7W3XWC1_9ACTN|nr:DUF308 domain-containing protein [Streptomyces calidiresistens]MBB0229611.1 HdeD family acid-resistance protein [Streptomyces calidiresistens]